MADIEIIGEDPLQIVVTEDSPIAITVTSGLRGPQGIPGQDGAIGPQGPIGPTGPQGIPGQDSMVPGPQGPIGPHGVAGQDGLQGLQGPIGPRGMTGENGARGPIGPAGVDGIIGHDGAPGPAGADGIQGVDGREVELNSTSNGLQWRYVGDAQWQTLTNFTQDSIPDGVNFKQYPADVQMADVECGSTGQIEGGTIIPTGGINFMVLGGWGYITDNSTFIKRVEWETTTNLHTIVDGENFVYIDTDGRVFVSGQVDDYERYIEVGILFSGGGNLQLIEILNITRSVKNFPQKVLKYQQLAVKAVIGDGSEVVENPLSLLSVTIEGGHMYVNLDPYEMSPTTVVNKMCLTSNYGWVPDATRPNLISPHLYNDITKGYGQHLVPLSNGWWKKDIIFRLPSGNVFLVYGQVQYQTKNEALNGPLPYLPNQLTAVSCFLCVIVSQAEDTSIQERIIDIRPNFQRVFNNILTGTKMPAGGTVGQVLVKIDSADFNAEWVTDAPAGNDKEILFNDDGVEGHDANFLFDKDLQTFSVGTAVTIPHNPLALGGEFDGVLQTNIQNISDGLHASADYVATADNGTDDANYIDMGINSSQYMDEDYEIMGPDDGYLLTNGGNLTLGTETSGKTIKLHTGGTLNENIRGEVDDEGINLTAGNSFRVNNFDVMDIITMAANASEEAAAFAAGSKIVIRTDLL